MRRVRLSTFVVGITLFLVSAQSGAGIVMSVIPETNTITPGTPTVDFVLHFEGTADDIGAMFDAFTYGIEAINSRIGADPPLLKPITSADLASGLSDFSVVDDSDQGAPNQLGGNATVEADSGNFATLSTDVLNLTMDTSGLILGDVVTIRPDLFGDTVAAVSFEGNAFDLSRSNGMVTAVPEPSSFLAIAAVLSLVGAGRFAARVRRRTR